MEIKTKFKIGEYLYTYLNGSPLAKFRVASIKITSAGTRIQYEIWTRTEHVFVDEESCFANLDELITDLKERFQELNK